MVASLSSRPGTFSDKGQHRTPLPRPTARSPSAQAPAAEAELPGPILYPRPHSSFFNTPSTCHSAVQQPIRVLRCPWTKPLRPTPRNRSTHSSEALTSPVPPPPLPGEGSPPSLGLHLFIPSFAWSSRLHSPLATGPSRLCPTTFYKEPSAVHGAHGHRCTAFGLVLPLYCLS